MWAEFGILSFILLVFPKPSELASPPRSPQLYLRRKNRPICVDVPDWEEFDGYRRHLPNHKFMVAVEGDFIIGAVTKKFELVPFYMDLNKPDRVKIERGTGEPVAIPYYAEPADPVNELFYKEYKKSENIYWAHTPNYNNYKNRCLGFVIELLDTYLPSVRQKSPF